ncbi:CpaF/VirB11 family protein [Ralstonia pseudosolanacearum]|uniref:CpaF/VirB11 family protein n=1 Tax=Ralstonia pseudosolanacearum TaxID=1310165 RepID=UPI001FFB16CD|nr:CpaF/VirB11 family protein [Ralstonia pseudosolanacearum]
MLPTFEIGNKVIWTSLSGGYVSTKVGIVEEIVPTMGMPTRDRFPELYRNDRIGRPRDHLSYVVRVPSNTARSAGTVYWPRASNLTVQPTIEQLVAAALSVAREGGLIVVGGATSSGKTTLLRAIARGFVDRDRGLSMLSIQEDNEQWVEPCELTVIGYDEATEKWASLTKNGFDVIALDDGYGFSAARSRLFENVLSVPNRTSLAISVHAATGATAVAMLRFACPTLNVRSPILAVTATELRDGARVFSYVRID